MIEHVLAALPAPLGSLIPFIVLLGILVSVHEFGHYIVARWVGVYVETFSIGFGPAIASWKDASGTVWKICCLPLGGYVKLHGQDPNEPDPEVRAAWLPGRTFHEKSLGRRAAVVAAGPAANFVLAAVVLAALFMTAGREIPQAVVSTISAGSPAAAAGLTKGDRILAIEGKPIRDFSDVQHAVEQEAGKKLALTVQRGDRTLTVDATPATHHELGRTIGFLGIGTDVYRTERLNPLAAVAEGSRLTWQVTVVTIQGVVHMVVDHDAKELGGPLRIAAISGKAAKLGLSSFVSLIALLSVNLGLINLFPIPVLDGGHLLFFAIEALRGRPLTQRAQEWGLKTGLALIAALFVFTTWNDIRALKLVAWLQHLLG